MSPDSKIADKTQRVSSANFKTLSSFIGAEADSEAMYRDLFNPFQETV